MESRWIRLVLPGTFLLGVPFIYEFGIHPLFGYLTALLVSWIIVEDFYDMLIDLRIAGLLLLVVLVWNLNKDLFHLFQAMATFWGFTLGFCILRLLFTKFAPMDEVQIGTENVPPDYLDNLQEGAKIGLMPILGLATYLVLMADMIFNPLQVLSELAGEGPLWAMLWNLHQSMVNLGYILGERWYIISLIFALMAIAVSVLVWRIRSKIRDGQLPFYPCGAGDPLVIGIFAAMVGAECFYFAVMMLTLLFGIMIHGYNLYSSKGRRIG